MFAVNKKISMATIICIVVVATITMLQSAARAVDVISADGAVNVNAQWEAGTSPIWYIEYQRDGAKYVEAGIAEENPTLISEGLMIFNWGWAKQGSDGSFPGTGGTGNLGGMFHSTSLFAEAAARATLELKAYHPSTYTLSSSTYASTITSYTTRLANVAAWLTRPDVAAAGQAFNIDYTHRRYILGATLQEIGALTNNTGLKTTASTYIVNGLSRQLGTGWTAALTQNADGSYPPATLVAPGGTPPAGAVSVIDAQGVNPERNGFDVSYQCVGMLYASRWYKWATDTNLKSQVKTMLTNGLSWERSRQAVDGTITVDGSTRIGIDSTLDGENTKTFATAEGILAFQQGSAITGKGRDVIGGYRLADNGLQITATPFATSGAVGTNSALDTNPLAAYNIALQKDGVDWIEEGIKCENDTEIATGVHLLDWGLAQQVADGSFGNTASPYTNISLFIEAVARASKELTAYNPCTHPLHNTFFADRGTFYAQCVNASGNWMLVPLNEKFAGTWSCYRMFLYANTLGEIAVLTGNSVQSTAAENYAEAALGMQLADGTLPDNGGFVTNSQAFGILAAERYYWVCPDTTLKAALKASIDTGLNRMKAVVTQNGSITTASPAINSIDVSYGNGYTITGDLTDLAYAERINYVGL